MNTNQDFLTSFKIAFLGLKTAYKEERNFRIQSIIGVVVFFVALLSGLSAVEVSILILMILLVLGLELINSQIEKFLDIVQPELHPKVKIIKDFSAAAVLLSAIGSVLVGLLIFGQHL